MSRRGVTIREIRQIETLAADAFVCRESVRDDGWRLRFNDGVTRRGNSVLAEGPGCDPLDAKLARVEAFYRDRGVPARFQVSEASQPATLAELLAARGYSHEVGAVLQTARLRDVVAAAGRSDGFVIRHERRASTAWLDGLQEGSGSDPRTATVRAATLGAVPEPATFVRAELQGRIVAVGLAVAAGPWLGAFNMATLPAARRRGAARAVLATIACWGLERGVRDAYLQVHPGNAAAVALYASLGFATHHAYEYWTAPA
ncbi:MAG: GNAT family N-acetyltransferase [Deinococcales bacterium]